jgi:hypothetical protein
MSVPSTPVPTQDRADEDSDPEYKQDIYAASGSDSGFSMPKLVSASSSFSDTDDSGSDHVARDTRPRFETHVPYSDRVRRERWDQYRRRSREEYYRTASPGVLSSASDSDETPLLEDAPDLVLPFHDAAPVLTRDDLEIPISHFPAIPRQPRPRRQFPGVLTDQHPPGTANPTPPLYIFSDNVSGEFRSLVVSPPAPEFVCVSTQFDFLPCGHSHDAIDRMYR